MKDGEGALLSAEGLRFVGLRGRVIEGPEKLVVEGPGLVLLGDAHVLLDCLIQPGRLESGFLELLGRPSTETLASGRAAVAPRRLPAPPGLSLRETLRLSARLVGRGKEEVDAALQAVQLGGLQKRKLGDLSPLQDRLSGLAHALLSNPEVILLEDPFAGLDEDAAELLELLLEEETGQRSWIASLTVDSPWARRLMLGATQALSAELGSLVGPLPPGRFSSEAYWARFRVVTPELKDALEQAGAGVVSTPHGQVLLLSGVEGKHVARAAVSARCDLLELRPTGATRARAT